MLTWDRSTFDNGYRKVFYVFPSGASTAYAEFCAKYGGDNVYLCDGTADEAQINGAIGQCVSAANDAVLLMPGSFTLAATISLNKCITLIGHKENGFAAVLAPATAIVAITVTAAGDYAIIKNLSITAGATAVQSILIPAACPGVMIDNVNITGLDTSSTQIGITSSSDNTVVKNCRLVGLWKGIRTSGSNCLIANNYHMATNTLASPVGVDMTTGNYGVITGNQFNTTTITYCGVQIGSGGAVIMATVFQNYFQSTTTAINSVSTTSCAFYNNYRSVLTTSLPAVIAS